MGRKLFTFSLHSRVFCFFFDSLYINSVIMDNDNVAGRLGSPSCVKLYGNVLFLYICSWYLEEGDALS